MTTRQTTAQPMGTTMRFTTVLWDCDGTLLDTLTDLHAAAVHMCTVYGWPIPGPQEFKNLVGRGHRALVALMAPQDAQDQRLIDEADQVYGRYYFEHRLDNVVPYDGIMDCLARLKAAGVKMGVLTNKDDYAARPLIEHFFPGTFDAVLGRIPGKYVKPEATMTLKLMDELGADPARTLVVGDTSVDIACGVNAGIESAGVLWGFRTESELKEAGADHIVASPLELASLILGS